MAASPKFKLYTPNDEYVTACKYAEDAAALMEFYGEGATIRLGHAFVVWTEGSETQPASESYDHVASIIGQRIADRSAGRS